MAMQALRLGHENFRNACTWAGMTVVPRDAVVGRAGTQRTGHMNKQSKGARKARMKEHCQSTSAGQRSSTGHYLGRDGQ